MGKFESCWGRSFEYLIDKLNPDPSRPQRSSRNGPKDRVHKAAIVTERDEALEIRARPYGSFCIRRVRLPPGCAEYISDILELADRSLNGAGWQGIGGFCWMRMLTSVPR